MRQRVWLAQLWAENLLGVLARSRTLYEETAWLVARNDRARALAVLPLCFQQPIKNHVDAYLRVWAYLRPFADFGETTQFFRLLQTRDPDLNQHLYRLVLRRGLWYLHNSRLFLANPCPLALWTAHQGVQTLIALERSGETLRPWPALAAELMALTDGATLASRALDSLVLLRVGDALYWNPKLAGLPAAPSLLARLREAGQAIVTPGLQSAAEA